MFQLTEYFRGILGPSSNLDEKIKDKNFPLEDYLQESDAVSCVKFMGKNVQRYFDSTKIKKLIKLIIEEPTEDDHLTGHRYPYIASEILKLNCPFISKRFILNNNEYDSEFKEEKEIDFDINKNNIEDEYKIIEEKLEQLKKKNEMLKKNNDSEKKDDINDKKTQNNNKKDNIVESKDSIKIEKKNDAVEVKKKKKDNNSKFAQILQAFKDNDDFYEENVQENNNSEDMDKFYNVIKAFNEGEIEDPGNFPFDDSDILCRRKKYKLEDAENNNEDNNENDDEIQKNNNTEDNKNKLDTKDNNHEVEAMDKKNVEEQDKNIEKEDKDDEEKDKTSEGKDKNLEEKNIIFDEQGKKVDGEDKKIEEKDKNIEEQEKKPEEDEKEEVKNNEELNKNVEKQNKNVEDQNKNDEVQNNNIEEQNNKVEDKNKNNEKEEKEEKQENIDNNINNIEIKKDEEKIDHDEQQPMNDNIINEEIKIELNDKKDDEKKNNPEKKIEIEKNVNLENDNINNPEITNIIINKETEEESEEPKNKEINIENNKDDIINDKEILFAKEISLEDKKEEKIKDDNLKVDSKKEQQKVVIQIPKEDEENKQDEELDNIVIIAENEEHKKDDDLKGEDSLSIEGEMDSFSSPKSDKKKEDNKQNNEYLDLLLSFVMSNKLELNYVLSGYVCNVLTALIDNYPFKMLKYLYTVRKDAVKKIIFHSNQKSFSTLSLKLLNIENYFITMKKNDENNETKDLFSTFTDFRNELIGEIIKSISLEGILDENDNSVKSNIDVESKISLIIEIINENKNIVQYLVFNKEIYSYIFTLLDTNLYDNENPTQDNNGKFDNKYNIYGLFINLITKLLKTGYLNNSIILPIEFDFNCVSKPKNELSFNENMIITFGNILKYNFLAKKPKIIVGKGGDIEYEGLGILNLKLINLIHEMFGFMKQIPKQFDSILIRNNFIKRSIDYFFKYQWNNIYHQKFIELFDLYLTNENIHTELTDFIFNNIKFHELLIEHILNHKENSNSNYKFIFKSGKSINSGIYSQVINILYKLQAIAGLNIFTEEEKKNLKIKNFGEFEFSKDEKSNKFENQIKISENIKGILEKNEKWNSTMKEIVLPILKKYETQLCKKEGKRTLDTSDSIFSNSNGFDFQSTKNNFKILLNVLKKDRNTNKKFAIPISRNDKNNKGKAEMREKILGKGYQNRSFMFKDEEEEEDDNKNSDDNDLKENDKFNDVNYWELKNDIPDELKKEVDKRTNIIFNYNPITGENDKKDEINEEDELLSIAMGLETKEKMEKNKMKMYMIPRKLKPLNLKTKSNPAKRIFNPNFKFKQDKFILDDIDKFYNNEEDEEEEGIIKKEDKKEDILEEKKEDINNNTDDNVEIILDTKKDKDIINLDNNIIDNNIVDNNIDNIKEYNDVNFWNVNSRNYLDQKDLDECLKDL